MYLFEFTDRKINIYNLKKKILIEEAISPNIIKDNKVYDYLKLVSSLNKIVNKHNLINSLFRIKFKILIFERLSPSEIYLFKNLFNFTSNIIVEIVNVGKIFNENYIILSGDLIYYENRILKKIKKGEYILIGNSDNFNIIKNKLEKKYKIDCLEYENSRTYIYENV